MKYILIAAACLASSLAYADYSYQIEVERRNCAVEQKSMLKHRKGTPACTRLNELIAKHIGYQRSQAINSYNQAQREAYEAGLRQHQNQNPAQRKNGEGKGYRWNPNEKKYCQHDKAGYPTLCY